MASMSLSVASFASASDLPRSSSNGVSLSSSASDLLRSSSNGVPLRDLGRAKLGVKKRGVIISAKRRRYEYPWGNDPLPDPNVEGGVLRLLSPFKPLKEKPKPVILDFEKPLMDLKKKIDGVQKMANETGLDFTDQILSLEKQYQETLRALYKNLTPIQRITVARHPHRPTCLDHIFNITEKFIELHGDRAGYDDPSIVTGLGSINGTTYMFIGNQKGRNTKENVQRNFGMSTPHGYRKALNMMKYANNQGFPIVTLIDTPGAFPDLECEEKGQGEAIAQNLITMFGLEVPIVSIVIGEGGSGGALAIGCANKLLMLENSAFFVASPEACASILWKDSKAAPKAAEMLKITPKQLMKLGIVDGVVPEPLGGAHADPYWTSQQIKAAIVESMDELAKMDTETLIKHRSEKFQSIGVYQDGIPIDPLKKRNMKKRDKPLSEVELKDKVNELKRQILEASKSPADSKFPIRPLVTGIKDMIDILKIEVKREYEEAAKALGMGEKFLNMRKEAEKANDQLRESPLNEQPRDEVKEKLKQLRDELNEKLPSAPNYSSLMDKRGMLQELYKGLNFLNNRTSNVVKTSINRRFKQVVERPDMKKTIKRVRTQVLKSGASDINSNPELKKKVTWLNRKLKSRLRRLLKFSGLQLVSTDPETNAKIDAFKTEVNMIKDKIELLLAEVAEAGDTPNEDSKSKIAALVAETKQSIRDAISSPELKKELLAEISEAFESSSVESTADDQSEEAQQSEEVQQSEEAAEAQVNANW